MNANVTDKAQETVSFIETIANTTPRKGFIYLNKSKTLANKLFKDVKEMNIDPKNFKFIDVEKILAHLLEKNADDTMQLLAYLFCCENEDELNSKVEFKDLILPLWQLWNTEAVRGFFSVLLSVGLSKSQDIQTATE